MAGHKHGSMNVEAQEKTFGAFLTWTVRSVIVIVGTLIVLAVVNA